MNVTSLCIADRAWRAVYGRMREGELVIRKDTVVGWAALDGDVWPLRVEPMTGRGVLVGSPQDSERDALLAVCTPGEDWESFEGMDERVRAMVLAAMEVGDVEDEDGADAR